MNSESIYMVRLIFFLGLILVFIWLIGRFVKRKEDYKNEEPLSKILGTTNGKLRRPGTSFFILLTLLSLALILWILSRFGINLIVLAQKIIPFILSLRGIFL